MYIGLDIGGSNISAGIFDEQKKLLKTAKVKSKGKSDVDVILEQIFKVINKLLDNSNKGKIKAIGITGFVDSKLGVLNFSVNINLNGINIAQEVPSMVILDGGVMEAIGERYFSQIKRAAMKNSFADIYAEYDFNLAKLGDQAGIYGAMELVAS